jgi:4-diphosphocytidyl-2-C-methyl-D-erythritol kinase
VIISQKSFAKINLFLKVFDKNSNNYHNISSLMAFIDIYDVISVEKGSKFELNISGKQKDKLPVENNILIKTLDLFSEKFLIDKNLKISLEKNIPISSGLGGGSSNAATLIKILIKIFNLKINKEELINLAMKIGSDVPFCLHGKIANISGIGQNISDADIDQIELFLLIINPNIAISTQKTFSYYKNINIIDNKYDKEHCKDLISIIKNNQNDLTESAKILCPEINNILYHLESQKNIISARLSGSGATCFGIFDNKDDLEQAFIDIYNKFPGFYIEKTQLLYQTP